MKIEKFEIFENEMEVSKLHQTLINASKQVDLYLGNKSNITNKGNLKKENEDKFQEYNSSLKQNILALGRNMLYTIQQKNPFLSKIFGFEPLNFNESSEPIYIKNIIINKAKNGEEFEKIISSFIWMSYRTNFKPIEISNNPFEEGETKLTTDDGWGCAIRVAQMALANGISSYLNEKSINKKLENAISQEKLFEIIKLFWDNGEGKSYPFSIQNICKLGYKYNKIPGNWFGFSDVSCILRDLNSQYSPLKNFEVMTFVDGNVYIDQILDKCIENYSLIIDYDFISDNLEELKEKELQFRHLLLFVAVRIGLESIPEGNKRTVLKLMKNNKLVGMMSALKNKALFFFWKSREKIDLL